MPRRARALQAPCTRTCKTPPVTPSNSSRLRHVLPPRAPAAAVATSRQIDGPVAGGASPEAPAGRAPESAIEREQAWARMFARGSSRSRARRCCGGRPEGQRGVHWSSAADPTAGYGTRRASGPHCISGTLPGEAGVASAAAEIVPMGLPFEVCPSPRDLLAHDLTPRRAQTARQAPTPGRCRP